MRVEVAVNVPVHGTFHYHLPPGVEAEAGQLVQVTFGTAQQYGVIIGVEEMPPDAPATRPIDAILDPRPTLTPAQIAVGLWISAAYLEPPGPCLWLFVPPGLTAQRDLYVTLIDADAQPPDPLAAQIVALLRRRGPLRGHQLNLALAGQDWRMAVADLAAVGVVAAENRLTPPRTRPRLIRTAALAIAPGQIDAVARHLGRESKRADLLEVIGAAPDEALTVAAALRLADTSRATLNALAKDGLVDIEPGDPPTVALAIPRESLDEALIGLRKGEKFVRILRMLARERGPVDVSWVYAQTDAKLDDLKRLDEEGLVLLGEEQRWRDSLAGRDFVPAAAPALTEEQAAAWGPIKQFIESWVWRRAGEPPPDGDAPGRGIFLLHGVTGSGKTEIYLRAIEAALAQGRAAIFLVPEIALTAQTIRRVSARFPEGVAVVHGELSQGERYDTWRRARDGLVSIAVGARSALFTPFPQIGVIILDEEHDHSYKQGPDLAAPVYHARAVAEVLARHHDAAVILGSATPDLESAYRAHRGEISYLRLPNRIMGHRVRILEQSEREGVLARYSPASAADALTIDLPPVEIVDMRAELKSGNSSIFSRALHSAIETVLGRGEQAMLFMNRRGRNTFVFCRDCGYVDQCPRCDLPLTYHSHDEIMRCHMCGYRSNPRTQCPACRSARIRFFGAGTQHIEAEMARLFPAARLLRWDADTARNHLEHDALLTRFTERRADVLIGTQMVAKGLDLPLVTLVGMVSADVGLGLPDFRAGEKNFQLLTQVAGRAGRGLLGGRAILQTYQPDHYVIRAAAGHDYDGFYTREIAHRRELGYPPFRRMARIIFRHRQEARAAEEAEAAAAALRARISRLGLAGTEIIGPAPCFFPRINEVYRWHLLLRAPDPTLALADFERKRGWYIDLDPFDLL